MNLYKNQRKIQNFANIWTKIVEKFVIFAKFTTCWPKIYRYIIEFRVDTTPYLVHQISIYCANKFLEFIVWVF